MYLSKEKKSKIIKQATGSEINTGDVHAQIALFTERINHLTEHVKKNKKDKVTERSLVLLVGRRRKLLDYLRRENMEEYKKVIDRLSLRK